MARFSVDGLFDFDQLLQADVVPDSMLQAAADVVVKTQKQTAKSMLHGKYATGKLADSISKGPVKQSRDGKAIPITFKGGRTRGKGRSSTRNAEIAFVNEYGKRGQAPRPFVGQANEQCREETIAAAETEYNKWLESMGF